MSLRDRDAYEALNGRLAAAGEFTSVAFGPASDCGRAGLLTRPYARVIPAGWSEQPDASIDARVRTVEYTLEIGVAHPDPWERYLRASRLAAVSQNLLSDNDLGGNCLPGLSALASGSFSSRESGPELTVRLQGSFGYRIPSAGGRDTTG